MNSQDQNQEKNKLHFEGLYANYSVKNILHWLNNLDAYLEFATTNETSWFGLYQNNFKNNVAGKKVMEMGCGDCNNAAVMAALGAEVYANDIASSSGEIVEKLNSNFDFKYPIKFIEGDFLKNDLPSDSFDFVVGKAFLHHLTIPVERLFIKETVRLLKPEGEARFFEPAVNNKILDEIRWYIPVKNRPSKLNKKAFTKWKNEDPHPERSLSRSHFVQAGKEFFDEVEVKSIGTLERFRRVIPGKKFNTSFTKWAFRNEARLPAVIKNSFARSHLIIYCYPISANT